MKTNSPASLGHERVLCVLSGEQWGDYDDELTGLAPEGVELVVQTDPDEALEQVARMTPRLVLVGMDLGAIEGLEFLAMFTSRYPDLGAKLVVLPDRGDPFPPMLQSLDPKTGKSSTEEIDLPRIGELLSELAPKKEVEKPAPKAPAPKAPAPKAPAPKAPAPKAQAATPAPPVAQKAPAARTEASKAKFRRRPPIPREEEDAPSSMEERPLSAERPAAQPAAPAPAPVEQPAPSPAPISTPAEPPPARSASPSIADLIEEEVAHAGPTPDGSSPAAESIDEALMGEAASAEPIAAEPSPAAEASPPAESLPETPQPETSPDTEAPTSPWVGEPPSRVSRPGLSGATKALLVAAGVGAIVGIVYLATSMGGPESDAGSHAPASSAGAP